MTRTRLISFLTAGLMVLTFATVTTSTAGAAISPVSLFESTIPSNAGTDPDKVKTELGMQFTASVSGQVVGVRFFKRNGNTGVHTGSLWSGSTRIATGTFMNETSSGWQQLEFEKPISIRAGAVYTASYLAPNGQYTVNDNFTWPRQSGVLTGLKGTYQYGGGYPSQVYKSSNYWLDVMFVPSTTPTQNPSSTPSTTSSRTPTPSTTSSRTPTPSTTPSTTSSRTPTPSPTQSTTTTSTTVPNQSGWPDASNTGTTNCPNLERVNNGDQIVIDKDNTVYENKELLNPGIITIRGARNVTIRCVKFNGTGWYGIDNTDRPSPPDTYTDVIVDQVDITCKDKGQVVGMLLKSATITRANVHNCDHMLNVGGDNVIIKDSYCHDLTDLPVVHADCIQSMGGNTNLRIEHNALWSRDTSDILLGQEFGDARNVVINNNRLMSMGSPPPAYLLYLSGTNTIVSNNRFTHRYTYGACTLNTKNPVTWTNNVWDDTGEDLQLADCGT